MSRTSLDYYCGIDELNLPYLAIGATGLVSVVGNVAAVRLPLLESPREHVQRLTATLAHLPMTPSAART